MVWISPLSLRHMAWFWDRSKCHPGRAWRHKPAYIERCRFWDLVKRYGRLARQVKPVESSWEQGYESSKLMRESFSRGPCEEGKQWKPRSAPSGLKCELSCQTVHGMILSARSTNEPQDRVACHQWVPFERFDFVHFVVNAL